LTRKRDDEHSTEFGLWLREQPEIDSYLGYRGYNLDYIWWKKKGFDKIPTSWRLIEEKRFMANLKPDQRLTYRWLHKKIMKLKDVTYKGIHLLQFENTNPEDGKIFLNRKLITKKELLDFLLFKDI